MADHLRTELVLEALDMAPEQRNSEETIHYSSRRLPLGIDEDAGVRPSMGSVGDCFDNAMCESFFATIECELIEGESFADRSEARRAVFDFVEGFYNPRRLHSALDYQSPVNCEQEYFREQPVPSERLPPVAA